MGRPWRAAIFAALFLFSLPVPVSAQDVTLRARNGGIELSGTLQGFDGEFYRLDTAYGPLTVDASGVTCDGPGCPDLLAFVSEVRIDGDAGPIEGVLPQVIAAYARARGHDLADDATADGRVLTLREAATGQALARFILRPRPVMAAQAALASGATELVVSPARLAAAGTRILGLDALVPVVAPDSPIRTITLDDLGRALRGEIVNWGQIGGPDMPLVLHGLDDDTGIQRMLADRFGGAPVADVRHPTSAALAAAVARDPWALAITGASVQGAARALALTDACGYDLTATPLVVRSGDYPLVEALALALPRRRLPVAARDFLDWLALPEGQAAIAATGLQDRRPEDHPLLEDGTRLANAIRAEAAEVDTLRRMADLMRDARRLSLTFRFEGGARGLDAPSRDNLADLARRIEAGLFPGQEVLFVGFSDGVGDAGQNLKLAEDRAAAVLRAVEAALEGGVPGRTRLGLAAFGEALPIACDDTATGRQANRRVEIWLRPLPATDSPATGN